MIYNDFKMIYKRSYTIYLKAGSGVSAGEFDHFRL